MGIAKGAAKLLLKECSRRPFEGSVLQLGRQHIFFSHDMLEKMAAQFGVRLHNPGAITLHRNPDLAARGFISDDCFFRALGFSDVKSLDVSEYESADYICDLNNSGVPEHLVEGFDMIFDGGTIEHVFHMPNALRNMYEMLRLGGRIIHCSPSSNYIDHGFYSLSPTFFGDFYTTNRFEINTFQIIRSTQRHDLDPWKISDYVPGCLDKVSFGGLDDGMYAVWIIVTKTEGSTGDVIPQQGKYISAWDTTDTSRKQKKPHKHSISNYLRPYVVNVAKRVPFLYTMLLNLVDLKRSFGKGLGLRVVARY